ncbi:MULTISPECIES: ABC transporter ATP-binding protein [unclassified Acetobacterium]|jgi:putative ABC transport system ATP-binding protein|uniref:ABC transporter ATP-binding protein n=1 Tax=unclassified Acetobacterium TaxID=2638182 RepID=UPI000DBEC6E3|nr:MULTISPECIES: ATP-binding cassette domain-containing protein [unclassified Acetobacterium]AWW27722.1 ABC transporter ATP-binding protein [Acetobacterium sp. KB-1]MDZ5725929.1 ATP-binding cassette domain-containing protein [Acetobacterium sp. K1/6]
MLKIIDLKKKFTIDNGVDNHILNGLNLSVDDSEFVTILGNNGAGKSTLFNLISGAILPNDGTIYLDEKDITFMPEHKRSKFIGRVFQSPMRGTAPNLTVAENLALAYGRQNRKNFNWALTKSLKAIFRDKLAEAEMGLENKLDSKIKNLSGGQCQVVALIMCTIKPPELILLDEHTAALDPKTAEDVMSFTKRIVEKDHLTALMITHHLEDAIAYGDRLIMMDRGVVAHEFTGVEKTNLTSEELRTLYHLKEG